MNRIIIAAFLLAACGGSDLHERDASPHDAGELEAACPTQIDGGRCLDSGCAAYGDACEACYDEATGNTTSWCAP